MRVDNNQIIDEIINHNDGIFDEVYRQYISFFIDDLSKQLDNFEQQFDKILINKYSILLSSGYAIKKSITDICCKTLISELYNNKKHLYQDTPSERYNEFIGWFIENRYNEVFGKNTLINSIINNKIDLTKNFILEILRRFYVDIHLIENLIRKQIDELSGIEINYGDTHSNGRTVAVLTLNNNVKVVYKPHSLITDVIITKVYEFLNNYNTQYNEMRHPCTIDCSDYGWQEYICFSECNSEQQVQECMYQLGIMIFVAYLLNITDLHLHNLYITGEHPYIIDTETMFYNIYFMDGLYSDNLGSWDYLVRYSVLFSGLLPERFDKLHKYDLPDLCGLLGGHNNMTYEYQTIIDNGTDNIRFCKKEFKLRQGQNIIKLNGNVVSIGDYMEQVCSGLITSYNIVLNNQKDFLTRISKMPLENGRYRQVFRRSELYNKYLSASYHPIYIINDETWEKVFLCIKGKNYISTLHESLVVSEIRQLKNLDIPYFYANYDSLDLFTSDGKNISNFYDKTIRQVFQNRISKLSKDDLQVQNYIVRCMLSNNRNNNYTAKYYLLPNDVVNTKNIADFIYNFTHWIAYYINTIHSLREKNTSYKLYYNIIEDTPCLLGTTKPTLYDGIGIAFFYLCMYCTYKEEKFYEDAYKLAYTLGDMNSELIDQGSFEYGVFDGLCSLLYLNYNAWKVLKDEVFYNRYIEILNKLLIVDIDNYNSADVISGCAGIVILLLNIYEKEKSQDKLKYVAKRFGEKLYYLYLSDRIPSLTGFAHGYAGIAVAFIKLSEVFSNEMYYQASMKLVKLENQFYDEELNNWHHKETDTSDMIAWCYGAPGIFVSRIIMKNYTKNEDIRVIDSDIQRCIKKIHESGYKMKSYDILCHGNAGNIDVMLKYYYGQYSKSYINAVEHILIDLIENVRENGWRYTNTADVINISFMTGISGLGYLFLRYICPEIPSVLFLESY